LAKLIAKHFIETWNDCWNWNWNWNCYWNEILSFFSNYCLNLMVYFYLSACSSYYWTESWIYQPEHQNTDFGRREIQQQ
jgi:hypothetical protein